MIIKNNKSISNGMPLSFWIGAAVVTLIAFAYWAIPKNQGTTIVERDDTIIFCGAENKVDNKTFEHKGRLFKNASTQTNEAAFEGQFSSRLNAKNKFSLTYKNYKGFQPNHIIECNIWVKSEPHEKVYLVAQGNEGSKFYKATEEKTIHKNGWHLLSLEFKVTDKVSSLSIYAYIKSDEFTAYVDNLSIKNKTVELQKKYPNLLSDKVLGLRFSVKAMDKLIAKRKAALALGLLVSGDDDWVKAKLKPKDSEEIKVKARLKGDWTDHLQGDFWSYRIKMPAEQFWNRLRTFSIQNPLTRNYLDEWVFHKFLEHEDILTPRYDFIKVRVNDTEPRVYAYEEHFEKQLAEFKDRREGVIIRYDESSFWDIRKRDLENKSNLAHYTTPRAYTSATVKPFGESKIEANEKLLEQFNEANRLLSGFQHQELEVEEVFDLDRLAKFYAICEILKAHHSTVWHNTRFYYNPIVRKLEPIGYDGFMETGAMVHHKNAFYGAYRTRKEEISKGRATAFLFRNNAFNEAYTKYLLKFSESAYLKIFFDSIQDDLIKRQILISEDVPGYSYDIKPVHHQAKTIKSALRVVSELSINAFRSGKEGGQSKIKLTNNHPLPLEIIGSSDSKSMVIDFPQSELIFANGKYTVKDYKTINIPAKHKYLHYRLPGTTETFYTTIKPWSSPSLAGKGIRNGSQLVMPLPEDAYIETEDVITIKAGNHIISSPIIIPYNTKVVIEPGANLDFTKNAYFLSYSPVIMEGTTQFPITITSSDKRNQGIHILEAKTESLLSNVSFTNLNTLSEGSWQLTGAVTFYESPVNINKVTIGHNLCEDALNTIRTRFSAKELHINNTFADGFDSDFCKGSLDNCVFINTGNDAIDFSGSKVTGNNLTMQNIGDKGISAGEKATLTIKNATIETAVIAVASKDLSLVNIENITISNCNQGFVAYQKKPEFGPGTIKVKDYNATDVKFLEIAENNSVIELQEAVEQ